MCGDIENDDQWAEELYVRFVEHVREYLGKLKTETPRGEQAQLYEYLDDLFRTALESAADPAAAPAEVEGYDRLLMEPLVYARLAGFIAAHQPLDEDPLKRLLEAMMTGYAEGEEVISTCTEDHFGDHSHTH